MSKHKKHKAGSFFDFLKNNRMIAVLIGAAVVVIIAAAVLIGVFAGKGAKDVVSGMPEETASEQITEENTETPAVPLEEDSVPAVTELIQTYYQAAAAGDMDTIRSIVKTYDEETLIYLEKISQYIEEYRNVKSYTKAGPIEDSYVVYAYYEAKFAQIDTVVPGVSPYLVYPAGDGSYYIHEGEVDDTVNQYLEEISAQDDVVDLMNRAQVAFNEAVMEEESLSAYLAQMKENLKVEIGEALAEAESTEAAPETAVGEEVITTDKVKAKEVVNVRKSDSEQAEKIGKVQTGDVLKLLESKPNGWSKVEYEGKEAFIKSEFLEPVGEPKEEQNEDTDGSSDQQADNSNADENVSSDIPTSGTVTVAETVNVRKSADKDAEKLAVCYQGEKLEILMKQADGWTKVKYKGKTGYVKSDVLKIMK